MKTRNLLPICFLLILILSGNCSNRNDRNVSDTVLDPVKLPQPKIAFSPEKYICYKTDNIVIDGILDEESWQKIAWTSDFVDIEGDLKPEPLHKTHAKMLWDDRYLYIAAEITEPHIWARLKQRDTVIFYDNDFEVFIDPDGDTHGYYEFEMNALNTLWDLLLTRPYRDYGHVLNAWDINGIETAVKIYGTINDPSDIDDKWVVELAFPLEVLKEWGSIPQDGSQWRINFSRVNWRTVIRDGKYEKEIDPATGRVYPEFNWVWSPQGVINMHAPETWAYLQFTDILAGDGEVEFLEDPDETIKWNLRQIYFRQRAFAAEYGSYASDIQLLREEGLEFSDEGLTIISKPAGYEAYIKSTTSDLIWIIDNTGRVYSVKRDER